MRELIACWKNTRSIVLIGLCSAMYAAVFFMFSWLPIIPGVTQFRPAASLPIVFSVFFGPVAAWGTAFGNVLGDLISANITVGSLFGVFGNFVYGYAPYRIMRTYAKTGEISLVVLLFSIVVASGLCAEIIALGCQPFKGLPPFTVLANIILINNLVMASILAPILVKALQKRIHGMKMGYTQILGESAVSPSLAGKAGPIILLAAVIAIYAVMMVPDFAPALANSRTFLLSASMGLVVASLLLL